LIADYISKQYIEELNQAITINSFITFYKVYNYGIAFSIFNNLNNTGLLVLNSIIIIVLIIILRELFINIRKSMLYITGLSMIFAGGLANLIDRFDNSSVTDFISLNLGNIYFPAIFNLADLSISFGAVVIIIYFIKEKDEYS
tara:strand:+ start:5363 stop:5791 length:429 start_codon:yes stop_codon:yes gene_type:complete